MAKNTLYVKHIFWLYEFPVIPYEEA